MLLNRDALTLTLAAFVIFCVLATGDDTGEDNTLFLLNEMGRRIRSNLRALTIVRPSLSIGSHPVCHGINYTVNRKLESGYNMPSGFTAAPA